MSQDVLEGLLRLEIWKGRTRDGDGDGDGDGSDACELLLILFI